MCTFLSSVYLAVELLGCVCAFPAFPLHIVEYFLTENSLYAYILTPFLWVGISLYITVAPTIDNEIVSIFLLL